MVRSIIFSLLTILMFITVGTLTAALEDGLVVYFTFDDVEGKTIRDSSGNGLDANIVANAEIVKGKNGNAIKITAQGADCVNVPAHEKLKISGEITMAAWLYQEAWNKDAQWFDKNCHNGGEKTSYGMGAFSNGKNIFILLGSGNARPALNKPHSLKEKTWQYVVGTYDGDSFKVYVDGDLAHEHAEAFDFMGTNDQDLRIGCAKDRAHYAFDNGMIDDAAIWIRALSEGEIKEAMGGGLLAVTPKNKAATTWGNIKQRTIAY
ncbi:hypothetical protein C6501_06110 [Candidatus Poribacteria bacterium]|nr:MAG: hypothetical protein C6501_06110 [Candidatus Poribacteria bacterium]